MTIAWFCKHGQVSGEVVLPDRTINTHELTLLVQTDHYRFCKQHGEAWVLFDGSILGTVSHDENGVNISLRIPEGVPAGYSPVYPILVLHVQ